MNEATPKWSAVTCEDKSCWHVRGPGGAFFAVADESLARQIVAAQNRDHLFGELVASLDEFMQINATHEYEFETNEKSWYGRAHQLLCKAHAKVEAAK